MSWTIPVTPQHSAAPLTPAQLAAGMEPPPAPAPAALDSRPWIAARIAACRACTHVARGGQTCAACDLRCAHPIAAARPPLLAVPTSTCPAGLWPLTT